MTTFRKKLIEVALPLDAINRESAREKSIRHGHPSTLHLWWARRPLASCRAVIFSSLVDDPGEPKAPKQYLEALDKLERRPGTDEPAAKASADEIANARRDRLFYFIERLVKWEATTDEKLLSKARELIRLSCEGKPPPVLDPFCGGGSIPLEAQRLGLEAYASDLNPVAVLITKALIEIPPKFAGRPPVNPEDREKLGADAQWKGAAGLAADVRYYGKWMRDTAWERIGHLYPKGPNGETVIAWLWARTVKCPNPACGAQMPLVRSFWLSTKKGREAWVEPVVGASSEVAFKVRFGGSPTTEGTMKRVGAACLACGEMSSLPHIRNEAKAGRMSSQLMALVAEGKGGRAYSSPDEVSQTLARSTRPVWKPEEVVTTPSHDVDRLPMYGMPTWGDAFSLRQLVALTTFSDLVGDARKQVIADSGGDMDYADAVATYLALAVGRSTDRWSTLSTWQSTADFVRGTFARQALQMVWDYAEANPFSNSTSNWLDACEWVAEVIDFLPLSATPGKVSQLDASVSIDGVSGNVIATDPPYYDNIGYADLSDYFYVWHRRILSKVYPDLYATVLTPKTTELIAASHRFGGNKLKAEKHFETGLRKSFHLMDERTSPEYPLTVYYAFKQAETSTNGLAEALVSTGWETMLNGLIDEGFQIVGTWPMRTERGQRMISLDSNALASSIVLVCRPRDAKAPTATFRQFQTEVAREMPPALAVVTGADRADGSQPWVDPIDLRQAAIGPGMAVYSRYGRIQRQDGTPLGVRDALIEINEAIDRYFDEMEGALDPTTRFCVQWYREAGFNEGKYGRAEVLAQAINVSVEALERKELLEAKGGNVRLYRADEYEYEALNPGPSQWELCHALVGSLADGEEAAARLYNRMPSLAEEARDLAYRLYLEAEKKNRSEDALGYNQLVASWTEIRKRAAQLREETQGSLI